MKVLKKYLSVIHSVSNNSNFPTWKQNKNASKQKNDINNASRPALQEILKEILVAKSK